MQYYIQYNILCKLVKWMCLEMGAYPSFNRDNDDELTNHETD